MPEWMFGAQGEYIPGGEQSFSLNDKQSASLRNCKVGFIFPGFNLLTRSAALSGMG